MIAERSYRCGSLILAASRPQPCSAFLGLDGSRWLTRRYGSYGGPGGGLDGLRILAALEYDTNLERALDADRFRKPTLNPRRPGRRGLPDTHYAGVAKEYMALREQGSLSPTADLAKSRNVSRNTAAGWVRVARERGFLPKARGNRPG